MTTITDNLFHHQTYDEYEARGGMDTSKSDPVPDMAELIERIARLEDEKAMLLTNVREVERVMVITPFKPTSIDDVPVEAIELWNKTLSDLRVTLQTIDSNIEVATSA